MGSTMFEERRWRSWNPSSSLIITAVALLFPPPPPATWQMPIAKHTTPRLSSRSSWTRSIIFTTLRFNSQKIWILLAELDRCFFYLTIDFKYFSYFLEYVEPFFMLAHQSLSKFSINFLQMSSSEWMDSICKIFKKVFHHCFNTHKKILDRVCQFLERYSRSYFLGTQCLIQETRYKFTIKFYGVA